MPDCGGPALLGLLRAAGSAESFVDARLAGVGLSIPKLSALRHLVEAGASLPLGQLAERLACVKSNVTQLVDRLEAEGLVARVPDPNDGRSRLAVLTDAGRAAYEEGIRLQRDAEASLLGALSPSEQTGLAALLAKLVAGRS